MNFPFKTRVKCITNKYEILINLYSMLNMVCLYASVPLKTRIYNYEFLGKCCTIYIETF